MRDLCVILPCLQAEKLATTNTFEAVAREWLALQEKKLAPSTFAKAGWTLETLVFPYIGSRPIAKLGAVDVLKPCSKTVMRAPFPLRCEPWSTLWVVWLHWPIRPDSPAKRYIGHFPSAAIRASIPSR
jgi:hypothetical protein